ncbi:MAG: hypothetical protein U1A78_07010 [Polyangia bacterium]
MDFLPSADPQLIPWLKNFSAKLQLHQKELGLADSAVKAEEARVTALASAIEKNEQKRAEYQAQVTATRTLKEGELGKLRATVRLLKAQPTYTEAIGRDLGIVAPASGGLRGDEAKPRLRAELAPGLVRLKFSKEGFDGVNLYREREGGGWVFLGHDTRSPFEDRAPLARPGQPELRRYRAVYVDRDTEIGEPSDTLQVTFAG